MDRVNSSTRNAEPTLKFWRGEAVVVYGRTKGSDHAVTVDVQGGTFS